MVNHPAVKADQLIAGQIAWENELRNALKYQEFSLHYQPILHVGTGEILGFEALLRWLHPACGFIDPSEFIPVAETTGIIVEIGQWVLKTACAQVSKWNREFAIPFRISVNLSARQIEDGGFADILTDVLRETQLRTDCLELELTEGTAFAIESATLRDLYLLHDKGVRLALDDFGTGYSSCQYLSEFPIDTLKIDRSFIQNIAHSRKHDIIITSMIDLAKKLDITCIAEGVETSREVAFLLNKGCDIMQGFYYSKPLSVSNCEDFIRAKDTRFLRHINMSR